MSTTTTAAPPKLRPSAPAAITRSRVFPFAVFVLTFGLLLSDYMSRQVLSAVFPFLKLGGPSPTPSSARSRASSR